MYTQQQKQAIAVRVLGIGKRRAPDRFPKYDYGKHLDEELINEWAQALGVKTYPLELWEEAVEHWINHIDHGRMATTGEILKAARIIREKWDSNPERREQMKALDDARRDERDRQIKQDTFGVNRGYKRPIEPPRKNGYEKFSDAINRILRKPGDAA